FLFMLFSLYSGAPLDLPSFPTRRSSDLSHYAHTHYAEHLDQTREIIKMKYPDYLPYFDAVLKQTSGYMFNMMIMEKELINDYCIDRKSTRLNSSHVSISYAVFCLKKKKT